MEGEEESETASYHERHQSHERKASEVAPAFAKATAVRHGTLGIRGKEVGERETAVAGGDRVEVGG